MSTEKRLPVSEGAMTALRSLADAPYTAAYDMKADLSALLDRMEVIDPNLVAAKVMETHRAYVRAPERRSFWDEAIAQKAALVAYVCGTEEDG